MLVALRLFREGCYRISIIWVFLCRRAKKNSNTLRVDRVLLLITLKAMKKTFNGQIRRLTARKWIYPSKKNMVLTSLGFSQRCWTIVRRNSSWDIWIPLMRSSCSESTKNMQFPSPWLSEIAKPFSKAVLFNVCDSLVLLDSMRASIRICWSATKMGSPVNERWKRLFKTEVISRQFDRRLW